MSWYVQLFRRVSDTEDIICDFATPAITTQLSTCPGALQTRKRGEGTESVSLRAAQQMKPSQGILLYMESKLPAMTAGRGEVVETAKKKLLIYPAFHFQKLRVAKTRKKIYGSNNCWWFINSHPGDPTLLRLLLIEELDSAQKYCSDTWNGLPIHYRHSHFTTRLPHSHGQNAFTPPPCLQTSAPITWVRFYGFLPFFFPASVTA